jgi:alkylhydroperoxidase/carboxymuconolactone decarboxylase family protein YurZ
MRKVPVRFQEFNTKHPQIAEAYERLAGECHKSGPLNERERSLVKLGVAIGSGMEGSVHSQVRKSLDAGLQPDEIEHAFLLALTAIGFPRMMAALTWAEDVLHKETKQT